MQQPTASPTSPDGDSVNRKAKLLALLDRARVNRGLQPERPHQIDAPADHERLEEAVDAKPWHVKTEPMDPPAVGAYIIPPSLRNSSPKCTCGHTPQVPTASTTPVSQVHSHPQASREKIQGSYNVSMTGEDDAELLTAAASTESSRSPRDSHSRTNSETSGTGFSGTTPTNAGQSERSGVAMHVETKAAIADPPRVDVPSSTITVNASTPKPRIADLTGGGGDRAPRLQQLKPLEVSRSHPHQPQPGLREEKHAVKRETLPRAQAKQPRQTTTPSNTSEAQKKLAALTPNEYEDAELHGDFQHMLHILIPSNATAALLERRGQPIQSIGQQAGCTLSIREPEASPFKDDRLLRIYGKAKGISLVQRLVIAYIRAYRAAKGDPNYMDLSGETPPVALPSTSVTKAMSVAVASGSKAELEIASPFSWMVQREEVGKMMGRQGSILASIRRATGADIHVDEAVVPGTNDRRVTLSGSVASIAAAVEEIKQRSGGRPEVSASVANGRLGQYFAIPYGSTGCLIGPQGSTVKHITERTGARLQIPSVEDLPLGSVNRILHVQGTAKQTEHARRVVGAKLRDYVASPRCPRAVSPCSTGCAGDKVTVKVLLPSRICGLMLDAHGRLIREISEKSGAHTHFLSPRDADNRVCVFTGDMSCVLRAQRLVLQVVAGDAISSKRVAPPRKRKRSQREDEEEKQYAAVVEQDEYEDEVEEDEDEDEYEEALRLPVRRQTVRRQPLRHQFEEEEDYEGLDEGGYEERPRWPARRRPAAPRPREYFEDEYEVEYSPDDQYDVPRRRVPPRSAPVVRRQPLSRPRGEYEDRYDDYDDEYAYEDGGDDAYEHSLVARKQTVKRRAVGSRPAVRPGRKVQMVAPSPREGRPRTRPTTGSARPSSRGGSTTARHGVPRGGRGTGRSSANRGRGNGSKRRRQ
jgi:hypothetical protein